MKTFQNLRTEAKEVWDKPNPVKNSEKLSPAGKARARARAKAAGRPYPNMVDNIWAARNEETEIDEAKEPQEYDYEGDMARSQLRSIIANAQAVHDMLEPDTNMAEWVQSKITLAADYISTAADYMKSEHGEVKEAAPAWSRKEGKSPSGGLNAKGVASYRRENPGSKLKMAVTTPPSKLDPDGKAAARRKSFCARMSGVEGPMKKPNGDPTRKALALRKWNC
jgi:hypothetical protein